MDLFEMLKVSVPKRDKLKQLVVAHTGLSPPLFVAAVAAGAATIAAITCYFKSTSCAATDRDINNEADGAKDGCCNCECKPTKETVNSEADGDERDLALADQVQAQKQFADMMASDYQQVDAADADDMATPVETPKEF